MSRNKNLAYKPGLGGWGHSLVAWMVKNLPAVWETQLQPLDQEDPLEKGMASHSIILAWRIPWTEEPGSLQFVGLQKVRHNWVTSTTINFYLESWLIQGEDLARLPLKFVWIYIFLLIFSVVIKIELKYSISALIKWVKRLHSPTWKERLRLDNGKSYYTTKSYLLYI